MSVILREGALAKVNLTLDVVGKRPDGYHNIESIMQTIGIRDDVELELGTGKAWSMECSDESIPTDCTNLAWRAAEAFCKVTGKDLQGLHIRITKRIPAGAGLGSGSADAGAVLRALNRHFGEPLSIMALCEVGATVGSDVPFCTLCGTAMCTGRGEILRKLPDVPEMFFVVVKPDFSVSTPALYQALDEKAIAKRPDNRTMESAILAGDAGKIALHLCNVFDPLVTEQHLELNYIKSMMGTYGAMNFQLTGTGSAIFGIFNSFEYAAVACTMLKDSYKNVFIAKNM